MRTPRTQYALRRTVRVGGAEGVRRDEDVRRIKEKLQQLQAQIDQLTSVVQQHDNQIQTLVTVAQNHEARLDALEGP